MSIKQELTNTIVHCIVIFVVLGILFTIGEAYNSLSPKDKERVMLYLILSGSNK